MEKLIEDMLQGTKPFDVASKTLNDYFLTATETEKDVIRNAYEQKTILMLAKSNELRKQTEEILTEFYQTNNKVAIEVNDEKYSLDEWLTIKEYCKQFNVKNTMIVTNWIRRKIIPQENILHIRKLNNLKLIKAVPYK